jgi:hypothetical protein
MARLPAGRSASSLGRRERAGQLMPANESIDLKAPGKDFTARRPRRSPASGSSASRATGRAAVTPRSAPTSQRAAVRAVQRLHAGPDRRRRGDAASGALARQVRRRPARHRHRRRGGHGGRAGHGRRDGKAITYVGRDDHERGGPAVRPGRLRGGHHRRRRRRRRPRSQAGDLMPTYATRSSTRWPRPRSARPRTRSTSCCRTRRASRASSTT